MASRLTIRVVSQLCDLGILRTTHSRNNPDTVTEVTFRPSAAHRRIGIRAVQFEQRPRPPVCACHQGCTPFDQPFDELEMLVYLWYTIDRLNSLSFPRMSLAADREYRALL